MSDPEIVIYERDMFGSHIGFSKTLERTYKFAIQNGLYSFQFYLGGKLSYKRTKLSKDDMKKTLDLYKRCPINVYTHCPLNYNLAGSISKYKELAWNGNKEVDEMMMQIVKNMEYELSITSQFGNNNGCIVHVGSWPDKEKGMKAIAKTINKINFPDNSSLLLENTAGKGTTIGKTFEELKNIYDLVDEDKKKHIKFCLDTCHTFCSGLCEFDSKENIDRFFNDFDKLIGINKLGLIHFNDSNYKFNTNQDDHACISEGYIWENKKQALIYMIDKIDSLKIPLVLETYLSDYNYIQLL